MGVAAFATIIHVVSNFQNFPDAILSQMRSHLHECNNLLELSKVSFLLRRQEAKPLKERDDIFDDGIEVRHLKIPNAVWSATKRAAAQVSFEKRKYYLVFLRYIEAKGNFPRHYIIRSRTKGDIETPFSICEPC